MTTYSISLGTQLNLPSLATDAVSTDVVVFDGSNTVYKRNTTTFPSLQYYELELFYPTLNSLLAANAGMKVFCETSALVVVSTLASTGLTGTTVSPIQVPNGTSITTGVISIGGACTRINTTLVYPAYLWIALFRVDRSNRYCIAFLEFQVTTPSGGRSVGINSTFPASGLLGTGAGSTDGIYSIGRILIPNNNVTTPSFTVASSITVVKGWYLGAEIIFPSNSAGTAVATVSTVPNTGGTTSSNISYSTGLPYAQFIGGISRVALKLIIS